VNGGRCHFLLWYFCLFDQQPIEIFRVARICAFDDLGSISTTNIGRHEVVAFRHNPVHGPSPHTTCKSWASARLDDAHREVLCFLGEGQDGTIGTVVDHAGDAHLPAAVVVDRAINVNLDPATRTMPDIGWNGLVEWARGRGQLHVVRESLAQEWRWMWTPSSYVAARFYLGQVGAGPHLGLRRVHLLSMVEAALPRRLTICH
jgi:hypothetical protein